MNIADAARLIQIARRGQTPLRTRAFDEEVLGRKRADYWRATQQGGRPGHLRKHAVDSARHHARYRLIDSGYMKVNAERERRKEIRRQETYLEWLRQRKKRTAAADAALRRVGCERGHASGQHDRESIPGATT
jgi:hypothetical protein